MRSAASSEISLESIPLQIWTELTAATLNLSDPWRTPVLASLNDNQPDARTVVLRQADLARRSLLCFSDTRARKVTGLQLNPMTAWCFYDPVRRIQLRAQGRTRIATDSNLTRQFWDSIPPANRRLYDSYPPPGERINAPESLEFGACPEAHFALLETTVDHFDWLHLGQTIHRRIQLHWTGLVWDTHWVAP